MLDIKRCAVIGAGLIGLCTALELQQRGVHVTLIDAGQPGEGASYGNAGFIASELIEPLATPATLRSAWSMLTDRHGALAVPVQNLPQSLPWLLRAAWSARPRQVSAGRVALQQLLSQAAPAWQQLLSREGLGQHLRSTHCLKVWERPSGKAAALQAQAFYGRWAIEAQYLERDAVAEIEPALAGRVSHALALPHAHRVSNPHWLSQALFERFTAQGGQFLHSRVLALQPSPHQVEVRLLHAPLGVDAVVLCAGVGSAALLAPLGVHVPLMAERGYHLDFPGLHGVLNGPVAAAERNVFLSPLDSGLRIVGFSELGGLQLPANAQRYESLRHHLGGLLPQVNAHLTEGQPWMGMRPTLPDSLPVIDSLPASPRIGLAFGHQHLGVTLAAISARLIAARMAGQGDSLDLRAYRVDRF